MATFVFTQQPRRKNSNEPLTYTITEATAERSHAGTLKKTKNRWRLNWRGVAADFDTKIQLRRHFALLGHTVEGLA
ncbi:MULTISPECIES: hypothetical protein [Methylobacterium]|jgi:hypothetical protein|uniref:Integrase n=1 Tax=Methylobacterium jeotgali TaxID=381630 RepID=A0ABQ4SXA4_9HYPH|nr:MULTISPECIES: hypothetical protein [Methylobacterium]PIU05680.1 MAG: hypothetical protein COT56_13630 [Methylobacterium sp. CG09_land_8_20_14_0_10_71_15]PIU12390.1 MAG: hypothetical protein COT28_15475 [Methylobacterium sp. CG08_land_8_20_14_0_20_71_15]GBU16902.1 hypothetical protein AwMethylo_11170 [Methylobacterium sp.]GJE06856.1 hypothetical protein AOPFMNJM_2178 [Methylobacterium jeotgali]